MNGLLQMLNHLMQQAEILIALSSSSRFRGAEAYLEYTRVLYELAKTASTVGPSIYGPVIEVSMQVAPLEAYE